MGSNGNVPGEVAMPAHPRGFDALPALLAQMAREDAESLLDEARSAAYARARDVLETALYEELLEAAARLRAAPAADRLRESRTVRPGGELWWTYCVLWCADASAAADGIEGVEHGTQLEVVADDRLAALVSPVPAAEYGDEQLRAHLDDLGWVERVARAHERVLETVLGRARLVPLRLCTLYREMDGVRRLLTEHGDSFAEALEAVKGCEGIGELQDAVRELSSRWGPAGLSVELTGPWPPSNFVSGPAGVMP